MYLYAIGTAGNKQKIGYSSDPERRIKTLQTGNSEQLSIHYTFKIDESVAAKFEKHIHREYNHKRLKGEWFDMSVKEVVSMMQYQEIMKDTIVGLL